MYATRLPAAGFVLLCASVSLLAQSSGPTSPSGYLLPPKEIVDILDATPPPAVEVSPSGETVAILERSSMPGIAELAEPMLRLGGVRINPRTNGRHRSQTYRGLAFKDLATGADRRVTLPAGAPKLTWVGFSSDGKRFAFTDTREAGIELWVGDTSTGQAKTITPVQLNAVMGAPCAWVGTGATLVCAFVNANRGAPPSEPAVPPGPNIQENRGRLAPVRTYEDLLGSAHDEAVFEYYATSQLAYVDAQTGQRTPVGPPGIYQTATASPDGTYLLVAAVKRPFSWLVPYDDFPKSVEIWDRRGTPVKTIADLPLADTVPNSGVLPGPRSWRWHPVQPATVTWAEALDGGDPKAKVPHRDRVLMLTAPFAGPPTELAKTEWRFAGLSFTDAGVGLLTENDRQTRGTRTWIIDAPGAAPRKLWERSSEDAYANPGTPYSYGRASGTTAIRQVRETIFLTGAGSSPQGDRPFLDRLNLKTLAKERLYQTGEGSYEPVMAVLDFEGTQVLTRRESRTEPPNVLVRNLKAKSQTAVTVYADPAPALRGAQAQLVTYQRKDGVGLRATIHTPPGWTPAQGRLPALLWAYPREFTDPRTAGQVTGSSHRFPTPGWSTLHLLFLTQGYAIIDDPTMPIVGPGETANDTYVEQLVASAQAAVDKAAAMGIVDPDRVVAGGHSYGAFMTANLLAHSDIFRAGIARSGAYNRTLTPFGFQNEQRTFWEVPSVYSRMSPFFYADTIKEPILLTHGEADDNSGTFPIQTERFYMALKGHGATVRYVTLPHEAHGYAARESVLHTIAEMLNWANEWGKNAQPRQTTDRQ
jgi:dipeptidyl aminopeptidase/acylaminoacyl peptidase